MDLNFEGSHIFTKASTRHVVVQQDHKLDIAVVNKLMISSICRNTSCYVSQQTTSDANEEMDVRHIAGYCERWSKHTQKHDG